MRPRDYELAESIKQGLLRFDKQIRPLLGVRAIAERDAFVEQLLESVHRVQYVHIMCSRDICLQRSDASSTLFDPLKAAELQKRKGNLDEAFWLIFLSVHFGKHGRHGWSRVRDVYGALGHSSYWTWRRTTANLLGFKSWLADNEGSISGCFGNHRKYQSLDAYSSVGTGSAVESYVNWINPPRTHQNFVDEILDLVNGDAKKAFGRLYRSMKQVTSFGRIGKFDYLSMLGKMNLAPIEPDSAYMVGATGPLKGARLLLDGTTSSNLRSRDLDQLLIQLGAELGVNMQVIEDAICNWQKSPAKFIPFRG